MKFEVGVMDWVNTDPTHLQRAANTSEPSRSSKGEATAPPTDREMHCMEMQKSNYKWAGSEKTTTVYVLHKLWNMIYSDTGDEVWVGLLFPSVLVAL